MTRRLLNWCYNLFILGCVVVTALAIALWSRSSEQRDVARLGWERRTGHDPAVGGVTACSGWECLMLSAEVLRPSDPQILAVIGPQPSFWYRQMRAGRWYPWLDRQSGSMRLDRYGFILYWQTAQPSFIPVYTGGSRFGYGPATNPSYSGPGWRVRRWAIGVPHWFIVLFASPWPIMWAMQRRRTGQGLCPDCGWEVWEQDLVCPGCGRRIDEAGQPSRPAPPPAVVTAVPGLPPRLPRPYPGYAAGLRFSRRLSAWRKAF